MACFFVLGCSGLQLELCRRAGRARKSAGLASSVCFGKAVAPTSEKPRLQRTASMNLFTANRDVVGLFQRTLVVDCVSRGNGQTLCFDAREEMGPFRQTFTPKSERCSSSPSISKVGRLSHGAYIPVSVVKDWRFFVSSREKFFLFKKTKL